MPKGIARKFVGEQFGKLTVIANARPSASDRRRVRVRCECGHTRTMNVDTLRRTRSCRSCAQLKYEHNSKAHEAEYRSWWCARRRCHNPADKNYNNYGARGIAMCERWRTSFDAFMEDMGHCPPDRTLDRIDSDGDYEPSNCRWGTIQQQAENRRSLVMLTHNGVTMHMAKWARRLGMSREALHYRIQKWGVDRALATPRPR